MTQGQCHCGNIRLSIPYLTETGTSCNCSICARYGAVWGGFTESEVEVTVGAHGLATYCHGDRMINFHHCPNCGCITHYSSTSPGPDARLAINYRLFEASDWKGVKVRLFDGANSWEYID